MLCPAKIKFIDDADLVEQERDQLLQILYHPSDESVAQFPDNVLGILHTSGTADNAEEYASLDGLAHRSDSSEGDESTTSVREEQSTTEGDFDDREEDDCDATLIDACKDSPSAKLRSSHASSFAAASNAACSGKKQFASSIATGGQRPPRKFVPRNGGMNNGNAALSQQLSSSNTNNLGYMSVLNGGVPQSAFPNIPSQISMINFVHQQQHLQHLNAAVAAGVPLHFGNAANLPGLYSQGVQPAGTMFLTPQVFSRTPQQAQVVQPQLQLSPPVTSSANGFVLAAPSNGTPVNVNIAPQYYTGYPTPGIQYIATGQPVYFTATGHTPPGLNAIPSGAAAALHVSQIAQAHPAVAQMHHQQQYHASQHQRESSQSASSAGSGNSRAGSLAPSDHGSSGQAPLSVAVQQPERSTESPEIIVHTDQLVAPNLIAADGSRADKDSIEQARQLMVPRLQQERSWNSLSSAKSDETLRGDAEMPTFTDNADSPDDDLLQQGQETDEHLDAEVSNSCANANGDIESPPNDHVAETSPEPAQSDSESSLLNKAPSEANISDDNYEDAVDELSPAEHLKATPETDRAKTPTPIVAATLEKAEVVAGPSPEASAQSTAATETGKQGKSWASLFQNTPTAANAVVVSRPSLSKASDADAVDPSEEADIQKAIQASLSDSVSAPTQPQPHAANNYQVNNRSRWPETDGKVVSASEDPNARLLLSHVQQFQMNHRGAPFQLRGLNNFGNWCYVNAVLQALISCPPFYHYLYHMARDCKRQPTSTPMLDALCRFVGEFQFSKSFNQYNRRYTNNYQNQQVDAGVPFEPTYVYRTLSRVNADSSAFKGRQEDAEEFLTVVLSTLHDELVALLSLDKKNANGEAISADRRKQSESVESDNNADEWHQVGPHRKPVIAREIDIQQSPVSQIFGGKLRYTTTPQGGQESNNMQPFFTLQLEIQQPEVRDVEGALSNFMKKEIVKDLKLPAPKNKPSGGETTVEGVRRVFFEELPIVLILHLKYFSFTDNFVKKTVKPINFRIDTVLRPDLLSTFAQRKYRHNSVKYKLFAVVYHHGEKAEGGHYTAAIFHGGTWVHIDDTRITNIANDTHLASFEPPRVPYLLFYRRIDTITNITQQTGQQ